MAAAQRAQARLGAAQAAAGVDGHSLGNHREELGGHPGD
jgi:hypothetical protein